MIFSPNIQFLSFSNKQKLDKKIKIKNKIKGYSDLPTVMFFGMLAETRVFFSFFFFVGLIHCGNSISVSDFSHITAVS